MQLVLREGGYNILRNDEPSLVEALVVLKHVLSLHRPLTRFDEKSLTDRISSHQWYRLQEVSLDALEREVGSFDCVSGDARVSDYASREQTTMPPIVLGSKFSSGVYEVVDGMHRAAARRKRGDSVILAYVPYVE